MPLEIVIIGYFTAGERARFFIHKLCKTNERGREQNSKINISLFSFNEKHRAVKCLTKEIKNAPECIVELYKHAGIFKNTREVHREARGVAECFSHFSSVLKNSQVLI